MRSPTDDMDAVVFPAPPIATIPIPPLAAHPPTGAMPTAMATVTPAFHLCGAIRLGFVSNPDDCDDTDPGLGKVAVRTNPLR